MDEKMLNKVLYEFLQKCKQKFVDDLISIILFGSYAKGTATEYSDVDLLVIVKNLPKRRIDRYEVLRDIVLEFIYKYGINLSPILIEPGDLPLESINPLICGILTGYKVIYDRDNFWKNYLERIRPTIKRIKPVFIDGDKRWEIVDLI